MHMGQGRSLQFFPHSCQSFDLQPMAGIPLWKSRRSILDSVHDVMVESFLHAPYQWIVTEHLTGKDTLGPKTVRKDAAVCLGTRPSASVPPAWMNPVHG